MIQGVEKFLNRLLFSVKLLLTLRCFAQDSLLHSVRDAATHKSLTVLCKLMSFEPILQSNASEPVHNIAFIEQEVRLEMLPE